MMVLGWTIATVIAIASVTLTALELRRSVRDKGERHE